MPLLVKARSFLRNLFSTRRVDVDLDQEVHAHLELLTEENIRAGMPPKEAQRAARIELGGIEQVKEQVREERIGNWLHSVISDCRYGIRQLRKNPYSTTPQESQLHCRRRHDLSPRHRRQHGHVQHGLWRRFATLAVQGCRTSLHALGAQRKNGLRTKPSCRR